MSESMIGKYVVVTTDSSRRGVFGGVLVAKEKGVVTLSEARMCVYWDKATKGVVGLAASGPTSGCRITDPAPTMEIDGVTCTMLATDVAADGWRTAPWSG